MSRGVGRMDYEAPEAYERLIAPRYSPIADALVEAAHLSPGERVLEVGAGTGLVTRRAVDGIAPTGSIWATDLSRSMLEVARRRLRRTDATFLVVDYGAPLPFLDAGSTRTGHDRFLDALRREAEGLAESDGSLVLDWTITLVTAHRPRRKG